MVAEDLTWKRIICFALLAIILILSVIFGIHAAAKPIAQAIPHKLLRAAGEYITVPYINKYGVCDADSGTAALDKIIQRITTVANISRPFEVTVIKAPNINDAFSAPGSKILLFSGLIAACNSADELTGILAHEIAHSIAGDPEVSIVRDNGLFIIFLAMFGRDPIISHHILTLKYSQQAEFAADALAIQLLQKSNINTSGLQDFLSRSTSDNPTHPATSARIKAIQKLAPPNSRMQPVLSHAEWAALKNICN